MIFIAGEFICAGGTTLTNQVFERVPNVNHAYFGIRHQDSPAQKLHQFLSSGLPRSGMVLSSKFSLRMWLLNRPYRLIATPQHYRRCLFQIATGHAAEILDE